MSNDYDFDIVEEGDRVRYTRKDGTEKIGYIRNIKPVIDETYDYKVGIQSDGLIDLLVKVDEDEIGNGEYDLQLLKWNNENETENYE